MVEGLEQLWNRWERWSENSATVDCREKESSGVRLSPSDSSSNERGGGGGGWEVLDLEEDLGLTMVTTEQPTQ